MIRSFGSVSWISSPAPPWPVSVESISLTEFVPADDAESSTFSVWDCSVHRVRLIRALPSSWMAQGTVRVA